MKPQPEVRRHDALRESSSPVKLALPPAKTAAMSNAPARDRKIAIVDDQPINIKIVQKYLRLAGYDNFMAISDSRQAVDRIREERPDLVLLDLLMPHVDGLEIIGHLRRDPELADLPIIVVSATTETEMKLEALRLGATEFLLKPVDSTELQVRVGNVLLIKSHQDGLKSHAEELKREVAARTRELEQAHREAVQCLAVVGEYRDNETGDHTLRVGAFAEIIAANLGLSADFAAPLRDAACLHDIGKVAIPDCILLKPARLTTEEFQVMKRHCEIGRNICTRNAMRHGLPSNDPFMGPANACVGSSPVMKMAAVIAYTHHERWDGSGYPGGLRGREIPIEGRITALADVFDALISPRPYKPAFPLDQALETISNGRSTQFDPDVVDAFFAGLERILAVYYQYSPDLPTASNQAVWHGSGI